MPGNKMTSWTGSWCSLNNSMCSICNSAREHGILSLAHCFSCSFMSVCFSIREHHQSSCWRCWQEEEGVYRVSPSVRSILTCWASLTSVFIHNDVNANTACSAPAAVCSTPTTSVKWVPEHQQNEPTIYNFHSVNVETLDIFNEIAVTHLS